VMTGQIDGALETATAVTSDRTLVELLPKIAAAQARTGDQAGSEATLQRAWKIAVGFESFWRSIAYRAISEAYLGIGDTQAALKVADASGHDDYPAMTKANIAIAHGDLATALEHIAEIKSEDYSDDILRAAITGVLATGDLEHASHLAQRIRRQQSHGFVMRDIASRAMDDCKFEYAVAVAMQIMDEEWRSRSLADIATAQANAGLGDAAVRTSEFIRVDRASHLPTIGNALSKAGDRRNFRQLLPDASQHINSAYGFCAVLARAFPNRAEEIAAVVRESGKTLESGAGEPKQAAALSGNV